MDLYSWRESKSADNSTVKISEGVERKGLAGGFGCPEPKTQVAFPEPYESNVVFKPS